MRSAARDTSRLRTCACASQLVATVLAAAPGLAAFSSAASGSAALVAAAHAQDPAPLLPFAADWDAAARRAEEERKLVLAIVQLYPGLVMPADAAVSCFREPELLDLVRERFVPLQVTSADAVPFAAPDRYGLGPHAFGASALVVTAEGDVVADTYLVGSAPEWLDEFLRGVLAERAEDEWDGAGIADPLERATRRARRGELDEAARELRGFESLEASVLRIVIHRRLREAEAARAELARVVTQLGAEGATDEVRAVLERERALLEGATPDTLLDAVTLSAPSPLDPREAMRAEREAVERLLADQQPDGSWIVGTDLVLSRLDRPDALKVAVTAIAAQALLPELAQPRVAEHSQPRVELALRRALPWLLAQAARARDTTLPRERMDYWPWAHSYLLWFLADAVESRLASRAELETEAAKAIDDLAARQQRGGGWSYLVATDPEATSEPLHLSMSFTTGAAVTALERARTAGIPVPAESYERAVAFLEELRGNGDTFEYAISHDAPRGLRAPARTGAAGRDAFLNHVLVRAGRGRPETVESALDRFGAHLEDLAREQGKTLMHCGPDGLGSHYVFFDYANTARVLAESARWEPACATARVRARRELRDDLRARVLAARLGDGSFVDNPLLGRAYGTAMAIQALRFLRAVPDEVRERPALPAAPEPAPPAAPASPVRPDDGAVPVAFERVVLDDRVGIGYGVAIADVDGDGRRDVVLVDRQDVRWYRAPAWEARQLCGQLTELDHVCVAARDLEEGAPAAIAIGAGWNPADTTSAAPSFLLWPGEDPLAPRLPGRLDLEPTLHRMRWVRGARSDVRLVALPLHGRGNVAGAGEGVRLIEVEPPRECAGGTAATLATPLHQTHNFDVVEWDGDAGEELVVAGREGLLLFDRVHPPRAGAESWRSTELVGPSTGHPQFPGASEVRLGRLGNGRRFLAAVEPFHGHALAVYVEPRLHREPWARALADDSLAEAHALACGDLLGRGDDQIVVGWRRPDARGRTGLRLFAPRREDGGGFERFELDERIACEDLALGDLDEDGRLDLVAAGRDSHDCVLFLNRCAPPSTEQPLARAPLDVARLEAIDAVAAEAIEAGETPGCVVAIGRSDGLAFLRAYGERALAPERAAMAADTLFDLASLTKPIVTATSVMLLVEEGRLRLDDPLSTHLPEFNGAVTVRQCLEHTAGFVPDNDLADYEQGPDVAWQRLLAQPAREPGTSFVYSDVGYALLGRLVERVAGTDLATFARERIFGPLAMADTGFLPDEAMRGRAAPTEPRGGVMLQGVVHDPRAALLGGVAGHAGLFSTAKDLARLARMLLNDGELDGARVLSPRGVALLTTARALPGGALRTPGFDARSRLSSNRSDLYTSRAFGHGGFTGTGLWIDPGLDLFVIFLGSRLHPDGKGTVNPRIARIGSIAAAAVGRAAREPATPVDRAAAATPRWLDSAHRVHTGLEQIFRTDAWERLAGRRIGLITNASARSADGTPSWKWLRMPGLELVAIFTPEHGFDAQEDDIVCDGVEPQTGIPIRSLYGRHRKPTREMLAGVDTLVFDVQDAGARCYTYLSTLGLCLEAAAEHGLRFVVLDRPNPIGGELVEGPLPDPGRESFTNHHAIAFRHGMTLGELAGMLRAERLPAVVGAEKAAALDLEVVAMEGWRRADLFDDTLLPWVNPSPNLRTLDAALLYPGLVLFERTNLSVGRGTDLPFEQIGAPWLDARALVAELATRPLPGARVMAVEFTPGEFEPFAHVPCRGLRVHVADRAALRPMRVALEIAAALVATQGPKFDLEGIDALLCSKATIDMLRARRPTSEIAALWERDAAAFRERRRPFLLYR